MTFQLDHGGTRKLPANTEEEVMMEAWCLLKSEEESSLPPSYFSFDY